MSNLSFEEFVEQVTKDIKDYLPLEYADAEVTVSEGLKINASYTSLSVNKEGQNISPLVNMDEMYRNYQQDGDIKSVMYQIAEIATMEPEGISVGKLEDYEQAKDSLFIRVCNTESNKDLLEKVPHEILGDLAVTYHVMIDRNEDGFGSTIINNELLGKFGIPESQLKADAMENSTKILSPTIESMTNVMARMMGLSDVNIQSVPFETAVENFDFKKDNMFVLSNSSAMNGAATIFYPEVMEKIGEQAGGDLFVIPSSVHEVLLVPDDGVMQRENLEQIIREINANEVDPKDRLSDSLYHYDSKDHKLERAVDFEERQEREASLGRAEKVSIKDKLKDAEVKVKEQKNVSRAPKEQTLG